MKAFVFEHTGDPNDVLAVRELPEPKLGPGEILARVLLSPVHPSEMHIMRGRFGRQPTLPASPGIECVGVVEALGSGVAGPAPGTRVALLNVWGSWRELIISPAERVIPVPGDLSDEDAAQALVNPLSAWVMTWSSTIVSRATGWPRPLPVRQWASLCCSSERRCNRQAFTVAFVRSSNRSRSAQRCR